MIIMNKLTQKQQKNENVAVMLKEMKTKQKAPGGTSHS